MAFDAESMKQYLKLDDKVLRCNAQKIEIQIPHGYFEHSIAEIVEDSILTFGIFDFWVYDEHIKEPLKFTFRYPSVMRIQPSQIEIKGSNDEKYYLLTLDKGDKFMATVLLAQDSSVVKRFIKLIFSGHLPASIPYNEIINLWDECLKINGVDLKVSESILEIIVAEFARNPKDLTMTFRHLLKKKPDTSMYDRVILRVESIPRYSSSFASFTSADPKQGLAVSVVRTRQGKKNKDSPIERAIQ